MNVYKYIWYWNILGFLVISLIFTLMFLLALKLKKKKITALKKIVICLIFYFILLIPFGIAELKYSSIYGSYYFSPHEAVQESTKHGFEVVETIQTEDEIIFLIDDISVTDTTNPISELMLAKYEPRMFFGKKIYIFRGGVGISSYYTKYTKSPYQSTTCGIVSPEEKDELLAKDERIKTKIVEYQKQEYIFWYVVNVPEEEVEQWFES